MTTIQGHVIDPQSHPVSEAAVYVVSSPASMPDVAMLTDDQGQFTLSTPVPGSYTVGVRSDIWGTVQKVVEVGEEPVYLELQF